MNKLIALVAVVGGVGIGVKAKGCLSSDAPDEQLASRIHDVCKIARSNVKTPNDGITELGAYLADHAGDAHKHLTDTVAMLVQIKDDDDHTRRVDKAKARWNAVLDDCILDWFEFADAVENDATASRRVEEFQDRLDRTIEELFNFAPPHHLKDVPLRLRGYLTTIFQPAPSAPRPVPPAGAL